MTRKMKLLLMASIIAVVILSSVAAVCYAADVFDQSNHSAFDKNNPDTWFEPARNGGVKDALVGQIKVGMSFDEIVAVIGKPQKDIGSGVWQMEWRLKSGDKFVVSFNRRASEANEAGSASEVTEYNLVSYYMEMKSK